MTVLRLLQLNVWHFLDSACILAVFAIFKNKDDKERILPFFSLLKDENDLGPERKLQSRKRMSLASDSYDSTFTLITLRMRHDQHDSFRNIRLIKRPQSIPL